MAIEREAARYESISQEDQIVCRLHNLNADKKLILEFALVAVGGDIGKAFVQSVDKRIR